MFRSHETSPFPSLPMLAGFCQLLRILWALPCSLIGALLGLFGLCTGGSLRFREGTLEFHGGAVNWLLTRCTPGQLAMAMTLGHVILGRTAAALDISREHELVHVRQYERWGIFFIPAYLLCSLVLWLRGRDPYRENPFEREAFGHDRPGGSE